MQSLHYIPNYAKSVHHETRNGILMCATHHRAFNHHLFYIQWHSETNEFVVINHSQHPAYESIHGNVLHFNTNTKQCPFPTTFLWHECRVRGFNPTYGDRPVIIKRGGLRGGGFFGRCDGAGAGAGEQVEGHDANASGHDDTNTLTFTPMHMGDDNFAAWLKAAQQHSSWKDCVIENLSWNGTAAENIEKYQHEVGFSLKEDNK
ncbi:hypothetical protein BYT27DRAFT_7153801 [Phlegmacium glaucopus]|nr:hypothetical protein BYT27DRAFT_7153801 [Phlegmacium glaucopus]